MIIKLNYKWERNVTPPPTYVCPKHVVYQASPIVKKKDMEEQAARLEGIMIGLINAQKKHTIDLRGLNKSYESMAYIIQKLS